MHRLLKILLSCVAVVATTFLPLAGVAASEKRIALVIGNAAYKAKTLATPANDAALIALTLQAAGFDVLGARDLDRDLLRQTFRDFAAKVAHAGPDTVVAVYFAGYGLQFEGENYLLPTDADISEAPEVPIGALLLSEQVHALAQLHLKATFVILDMARVGPFVSPGRAGGLAWAEPEENTLIAFNAAPGTAAPDAKQGYAPYAKALAEMIRQGDLTPENLFDRVRLRVNELTGGAQVPWDASKIESQFKFYDRAANAPLRADSSEHISSMRFQPMRSIGPHDAYMVALMRDTLDAYADFLADYWHDPMTRRVQALSAVRREAITWRRTFQAGSPEAYWSYLERYPRGPHVADVDSLLKRLGASITPPSNFVRMDYDVPSPLPDELDYIERSTLVFDDPTFNFERPQPPPIYFLAPSPPELLDLTPQTAPFQAHFLPSPSPLPLPSYVHLSPDVAQPNARPLSVEAANGGETNDGERVPSLSILSRDNADNSNSASGALVPASAAVKAALLNAQRPPPTAANPATPGQIAAPPAPSLKTASLTPLGSTDTKATTTSGIERAASTLEIAAPLSVPTTLASTGVPIVAWTADIWWRATGGPPPMPRLPSIGLPEAWSSETLLWRPSRPLPWSSAPQTTGALMRSPETTGSIPVSVPPPATLTLPSGVLVEAWSSDMLLWRQNGRSSLTRLGNRLVPRAATSAMPSPQTTSSILASIPRSVTFAPPSNGVLPGAWNSDMLLWRASVRSSRSLTPGQPHTGFSRTPASKLSPQTTSSNRPATSRSAPPTPPRSSRSTPIAEAASTSSQ
jgi:uncharacterized caspase-like protein